MYNDTLLPVYKYMYFYNIFVCGVNSWACVLCSRHMTWCLWHGGYQAFYVANLYDYLWLFTSHQGNSSAGGGFSNKQLYPRGQSSNFISQCSVYRCIRSHAYVIASVPIWSHM